MEAEDYFFLLFIFGFSVSILLNIFLMKKMTGSYYINSLNPIVSKCSDYSKNEINDLRYKVRKEILESCELIESD